jgi:simple sugar transport system ATP-binding protein
LTNTDGLSLRGISKSYGECHVLHDVVLDVAPARVHALVGENGAGKSTMIRVACGLVAADKGDVFVRGHVVRSGDARAASRAGIGVVHQHFMLVDTMTVAENVVLGAEPRRFGFVVDRERARCAVKDLSAKYGLAVEPDAVVESLAVGERQRVELLKVLYRGARYVLLDEPTAVLSPNEIAALLDTIRGLVRGGAGVLFVSHKLDEVMAVADDVTVLRRGRVVLRTLRSETDAGAIARAVVGGEVPRVEHSAKPPREGEGLVVESISADIVRDLSLRVAPGEVLGIAGVEGNGQRTLAQAIAGLTRITRGSIRIGGRDIADASVDDRRRDGLGYVPEDREGTGLLPTLSITENLLLGDPANATRAWAMLPRDAEKQARESIARFAIRPDDPHVPVGSLSGGNAQKVLIARELTRSLRALVVAQPTRGIDLGAAVEVQRAIRRARDEGVAVLLISSDLDEIRTLSDRVAVMRGGRLVAEMPVAEASDARLGPLMIGHGNAA